MSACVCAWGQVGFLEVAPLAQLRDGVIDAGGQFLYCAAYDRNEVWRIALDTHAVDGQVAVGKGPSAIALSPDGSLLACVNRLDASLSVIRTSDLAVVATVPCGEGASDVAAMSGGRFAVANTFADTLTLLQIGTDEPAVSSMDVSSVLNGVAASGEYLGVTTRVPAALVLYRDGKAVGTTSLRDVPRGVAALGGTEFVVTMNESVAVVDAARGVVTARASLAVRGARQGYWSAGGERPQEAILGILGDDLIVMDRSLREQARVALTSRGYALAGSQTAIAVFSPKARTWQVAHLGVRAVEPVPVAEVPVVSQPTEPLIVEAETIGEEAVAAPGEPVREPVVVAEPAVRDEAVEEEAPAPVESEEAVQPVEEEVPAIVEPEVVDNVEVDEPSRPQQNFARNRHVPEVVAEREAEEPGPEPEPVETAEVAAPVPQPAPEVVERPSDTAVSGGRRNFMRKRPKSEDDGPVELTPAERRPGLAPFKSHPRLTLENTLRAGIPDRTPGVGLIVPDTDFLDSIRADQTFGEIGEENPWRLSGNVRGTMANTVFEADEFSYDPISGIMTATGNVVFSQQEARFYADHLEYHIPEVLNVPEPAILSADLEKQERDQQRLAMGTLTARNVRIVEPDEDVVADSIHYDFASETGELTNVEGRWGIYIFGAEKLRILGPRSVEGDQVWITTCDRDHPHYCVKLREARILNGTTAEGTHARLQLGRVNTPVYWPRWRHSGTGERGYTYEFESGHSAEIGYYINTAEWFPVTPYTDLAVRLMPTSEQGVGFGIDLEYDYGTAPASPLYRAKGQVETLVTTEGKGMAHLYHRQELGANTVLLGQLEHWYEQDFYKDFFYDKYRDRAEPRSFLNLTYTGPSFLATATARGTLNNYVTETNQLPEVTLNVVERRLFGNVYFTNDTLLGYYEREPSGVFSGRLANVARLTLDLNLHEALNVAPFVEAEGAWYSNERNSEDDTVRFSNTSGVTLQTRLHRTYPGFGEFSEFKHIILPSFTYSYRPEPTVSVTDTPRFDVYDNAFGRSRLESKIDNVVLGKDAQTGETWQVARLSIFQGSDFWNELAKTRDYEIELDVRPRPWWGLFVAAERHSTSNDYNIDTPFYLQRRIIRIFENATGRPFSDELNFLYNGQFGKYDRLLAEWYFDQTQHGGNLQGRVGFSYTKTLDRVFNREVLYGLGYRLSKDWAVSFQHRYDFERGELHRQTYELRRRLHCWEMGIRVNDRPSGLDFGVEFSITAFPGNRFKL